MTIADSVRIGCSFALVNMTVVSYARTGSFVKRRAQVFMKRDSQRGRRAERAWPRRAVARTRATGGAWGD